MSTRIESLQSTGNRGLDPRLVVGGLTAALAAGLIAGYMAGTLGAHGPSAVVSRAPAAGVSAPSTGVYGDRDSRLPIASGAAVSTSGVFGDRDSRLPIANGAVTSPAGGLCDRNSCGTLVSGSKPSELDRAIAARVTALQGMAGVDWSAVGGDAYGVRDSRPPLAPFKLR